MTGKEILDDAGYLLGIKRQGLDLEEEEYSQGIRIINRIFSNLDKRGYRIGFSQITDKSQNTRIPTWAELYTINQTAIDWSGFFQISVPESVAVAAGRGFEAIEAHLRTNELPLSYHPKLPMGMNGRGYTRRRRFYGKPYENVIHQGNNIILNERGKSIVSERED